jgi:hypothetical protein
VAEWVHAQKDPAEELAQLHHFSFKKRVALALLANARLGIVSARLAVAAQHDTGDPEWIAGWLEFKRAHHENG